MTTKKFLEMTEEDMLQIYEVIEAMANLMRKRGEEQNADALESTFNTGFIIWDSE